MKHVPLLNSYDPDKAPARCQRLLMRLIKFTVEAVHVPREQLVVSDSCMSDMEHNIKAYVQTVITTRSITADRLDAIREAS